MNINKINDLCLKRGITLLQLSKKIGMSNSFYTTLKTGSLKVETLEKIAEVLEVPIIVFFEDENEKWTKSSLIDEVKRLDEENEVLWNRIDELMETIRSKRSILRLTYNQLKSIKDKRLDVIIEAIDESEKFENPEPRTKRRVLGLDLGTNSIGMAVINTDVKSDNSIVEHLANTQIIPDRVKSSIDKRARAALQKVISDLVAIESKIDKSKVLDEKDIISFKSLLVQSNEIMNKINE